MSLKEKSDPIIGRRIVAIRQMTRQEMKANYWHRKAVVVQLDDGTMLYPSQDDEGNGPGALFGVDWLGRSFGYPVTE
jgi:hypothetical protein